MAQLYPRIMVTIPSKQLMTDLLKHTLYSTRNCRLSSGWVSASELLAKHRNQIMNIFNSNKGCIVFSHRVGDQTSDQTQVNLDYIVTEQDIHEFVGCTSFYTNCQIDQLDMLPIFSNKYASIELGISKKRYLESTEIARGVVKDLNEKYDLIANYIEKSKANLKLPRKSTKLKTALQNAFEKLST